MLAAGNAGIEAATNEVIAASETTMLIAVCGREHHVLLTFRSLAATLCVILPLVLTSILGNALMAFMGIGVKVATLPVIALGVIGVDYGIYIYSRLESFLRQGHDLAGSLLPDPQIHRQGGDLHRRLPAIGVVTWVFSAIKFRPTWV